MLVQAVVLVLALCQIVVGSSCGNITITSNTNTTDLDSSCSSHEVASLTISTSTTGAVSIANIQKITGTLTLTGTDITKLSLPDLQSIGGALRVTDNANLRNVSLPELQSVGDGDEDETGGDSGVTVNNNAALETVDMSNLQDVYGGLTLHGGFTLAISSLQKVSGAASFSGSQLSCGLFDRLAADGDFSNSYTCSTGGSSGSKKGLSGGAKAGIAIGVIVGVGLLAALCVWLWLRRRRRARSGPGVDPQSPGDDEKGFAGYSPVPVSTAAPAPAPAPAPETDAGRRPGPNSGLNIPRKPFPSQHEPPPRPEFLDGNSIYEAGAGVQSPVVHELDAGPQSRHQIPINHE